MRLCLLAEAGSIHTRRWAEYFASRGDDVLVLSLRPGEIPGVRVMSIAPPRLGRAGYLLGVPAARAAVRAFRPELLHAHYAASYGLIGALVGFGGPFVVSSWGSDVTSARARLAPVRAALRFVFGRADQVCATSQFLAEATRPFVRPGREIAITPFGVDLDRFRPAPRSPRDRVVVGTARALRRIYGLDVLLRAFALMPTTVRLLLAGEGPERARLAHLATELGLADRVEFRGHVAHSALPATLAEMDIFAVPSRVPEAFGVAAVEASACALPVVASATGGLPEVVEGGKTGFLVPPEDVDALADRLTVLAREPARRARMGSSGRALVSTRYDWRENAQRMAAVYAPLIRHS